MLLAFLVLRLATIDVMVLNNFIYHFFGFQISKASLESTMLKYSVKEYFFRATLCHLCVDILDATRALESYIVMYPAFQDSREYKLLKVRFILCFWS